MQRRSLDAVGDSRTWKTKSIALEHMARTEGANSVQLCGCGRYYRSVLLTETPGGDCGRCRADSGHKRETRLSEYKYHGERRFDV